MPGTPDKRLCETHLFDGSAGNISDLDVWKTCNVLASDLPMISLVFLES